MPNELETYRIQVASERKFLKYIKSGYVPDREHTLQEIAGIFGVSHGRVRQILNSAEKKLAKSELVYD